MPLPGIFGGFKTHQKHFFFTFLEPGKKSENFFSRKNWFFFGKNRDLSEIIGIFPKNRRFFAEIFLNHFSMDFSSPLQPITEKSTDFSDFSDFLFPGYNVINCLAHCHLSIRPLDVLPF